MKKYFSKNILKNEEQLLDSVDFEGIFNQGVLLKKDSFSEARLLTIDETVFFVKLYKDKGFLGKVKRLIKLSRAWSVFKCTEKVYKSCVFLPRPLAYLEQADGAFYVAEGFASSVDLRAFEGSGQELIEKYALVERVASMLADLHNAGFSHGDMKWGNVLFLQNKDEIRFVDWDGCKQTMNSNLYHRDVARFIVGIRESKLDKFLEGVFLASYKDKAGRLLNKETIDLWVKEFELRHKAKESKVKHHG